MLGRLGIHYLQHLVKSEMRATPLLVAVFALLSLTLASARPDRDRCCSSAEFATRIGLPRDFCPGGIAKNCEATEGWIASAEFVPV